MDYIKTGKFMSLILRHSPETIGISLDENGWADVDELLKGMKKKGHNINMFMLEEIVATNNKKRYSLSDDKTKIRANQGHSINVDVQIKQHTPPPVLYHGTAERFLDEIKKDGISKRNRQHVHLSEDVETAVSVGKRHGRPVVLRVDAAAMEQDGFKFWLSENGVWLCEQVPCRYVSVENISE